MKVKVVTSDIKLHSSNIFMETVCVCKVKLDKYYIECKVNFLCC